MCEQSHNKKTPGQSRNVFMQSFKVKLLALDGQEAVAWVFVDDEAFWQVASLRALILAEVVNGLHLTAAERNLL